MKKNILIIAANSSLVQKNIEYIVSNKEYNIGLHYSINNDNITNHTSKPNVFIIQKSINTEDDCLYIVNEFVRVFGNIDCLIIMIGGSTRPCDWSEMTIGEMQNDYLINAILPFMLAKHASKNMKDGGNIVFISTSSAKRGGGRNTLGYGMSKSALECCTKRLAKDLAENNIAINAIAPGYMATESQIKFKTTDEISKRISYIPMKKAGTKDDFAGLLSYFIESNSFMTGQIIALDGGDFV